MVALPPASLTSYLSKVQSPVCAYLTRSFPGLDAVAKLQMHSLKDAGTLRPEPMKGLYPYGLVGTAFDYGVRLLMGEDDLDNTVAGKALRSLERSRERNLENKATRKFWKAFVVASEVRDAFPSLLERGKRERSALLTLCFALASFEVVVRNALFDPTSFPLNLEALLAQNEPVRIDDLERLLNLAEKRLDLSVADHRFNPVLGHAFISADADLVKAGCLIELKCTTYPTRGWRGHLRQLVGYLLLDQDDRLSVERLAIYLGRQGHLAEWGRDELLRKLGAEPKDLAVLRQGFYNTCEEAHTARERAYDEAISAYRDTE